ncbi:MAG: exodeoxyribonuclease VII large subunit [Thermoguttaceae bacterium]
MPDFQAVWEIGEAALCKIYHKRTIMPSSLFPKILGSPHIPPLTVTEFSSMLKPVVEEAGRNACVIGEVSDYTRSKTGHVYFRLKDESAQLGCTIWRSNAARLPIEIKNGLTVVCKGNIQVYLKGGSYSLIVNEITPQGIGSLELAFRRLQEKLSKEGLFDASGKKPIPEHPRKIAVVTSATGAALRDFLNILRRRTRRVDVLICPVLVQGTEAAGDIEKAFATLNTLSPEYAPDVIVLIRGGGSMEDLWPFNEEKTVRAIAASAIPVVTGIGHEIDVTLSDLAADFRGLTPSDAADRLIPDDSEFPARLDQLEVRLQNNIRRKLSDLRTTLERISGSPIFLSPTDRLLGMKRMALDQVENRLDQKAGEFLLRGKNRFSTIAVKLEALSPLGILARGYSITTDDSGHTIRDVAELSAGKTIQTRLHRGKVRSTVVQILPPEKEPTP